MSAFHWEARRRQAALERRRAALLRVCVGPERGRGRGVGVALIAPSLLCRPRAAPGRIQGTAPITARRRPCRPSLSPAAAAARVIMPRTPVPSCPTASRLYNTCSNGEDQGLPDLHHKQSEPSTACVQHKGPFHQCQQQKLTPK